MQDQLRQILEQQLRDLHLPEQVSWWPLATGWWILLVLSLLGLGTLTYLVKAKLKRNRYRKAALSELQSTYLSWQKNQDSAKYLQGANAILKRCMMHICNDTEALSQTGQTWITTLNQHATKSLSPPVQTALGLACYQSTPTVDVESLHPQITHWIKSHRSINNTEQSSKPMNEATHA